MNTNKTTPIRRIIIICLLSGIIGTILFILSLISHPRLVELHMFSKSFSPISYLLSLSMYIMGVLGVAPTGLSMIIIDVPLLVCSFAILPLPYLFIKKYSLKIAIAVEIIILLLIAINYFYPIINGTYHASSMEAYAEHFDRREQNRLAVAGNPEQNNSLKSAPSYMGSVQWCDKNKKLVSGSGTVWDAASGEIVKRFPVSDIGYVCSPDGKYLVSIDKDETTRTGLRIWNLKTGSYLKDMEGPFKTGPNNPSWIFFEQDSSHFIAFFNRLNRVVRYETSKFTETGSFSIVPYNRLDTNVAISADGNLLAFGADSQHSIFIVDAKTGSIVKRIATEKFSPNTVAFAPDAKSLFVAGMSARDDMRVNYNLSTHENMTNTPISSLHEYDPISGEIIRKIKTGHIERIDSITFNKSKDLLVTDSADKTIEIRELSTGKLISTLNSEKHISDPITFESGNRFLSSTGREVYLWAIDSE